MQESPMERIAVRSRDIAIVGYEPASQLLEIAFRNGGVYQYANVPPEIHKGLMDAASHGVYFNKHIKDQYPSTKTA